ncbi:urea carboxylase-associated family protein [Pseudomonas baltica]|uniref:urea carboxylase-associated family protein n=1 Tax=Pseudomonas baltica TaxID=2762576 RepID=UPI00289A8095|nr:urea carboxylase-associated family protein [Pseudomonas baltica]
MPRLTPDDDSQQILKATRGTAIELYKGEAIRITNLHGSQVVDTWAVNLLDSSECGALEHTRSINSNIFFETGMTLVSNLRRPMLTLIEDTSPGRHDTLLCPCNSAIYQELGCTDYHRSCTDNFHEALAERGVACSYTPASLNLFMNIPVADDGSVQRVPPRSRPGDSVTLLAEMDVLVVLSACPQDITPINGAERQPSDIAWVIQTLSAQE